MALARRLLPAAFSMVAALVMAAPAAVAQTAPGSGTTGTTIPGVPLPTTTTLATNPSPATTTTTQAPATTTTSTTAAKGKTPTTGVPSVPVGGPPTTVAPAGAKPAPPPDPDPILEQVDGDLAQLTAISDYKPAQALVSAAQGKVTEAGATLLTARQNLDTAEFLQALSARDKSTADAKLRQLAVAAYMGVGFTSPSIGQSSQANGDQGAGTVSTPDGLTGIEALDAKEMLVVVGEHARQSDDDAAHSYARMAKATAAANTGYKKARAAVGAAEAQLLADQQTLKTVTEAAVTPGAASATDLAALLTKATAATAATAATDPTATPPTSASTTTTTTTTDPAPAGLTAAAGTANAGKGAHPPSPTIMGAPLLDQAHLQAWWATLSRKPNVTVPVDQLIASYSTWGQKLGIRDDIAFAQSIVETGYFSFPTYGQLTPKDNNFAGIGACDSCAHGWSFPDADTGVQAQLELLREYATNSPLPTGVKNVIGGTGIGGCCSTWTQLAGKWASSTVYGISIMTVYQQMLSWLIPQEELSNGLIAPNSPAANGPQLAPLPGSTTTTTTTVPGGVSAASARIRS